MTTQRTQFSDLIGHTFSAVENVKVDERDDVLRFTRSDGRVFEFYHEQDCCETVEIEDITGSLADLVGAPMTLADEAVHDNDTPEGTAAPDDVDDSYTWTFYRFATVLGFVTVRWLGSSNGYYSESVSFREVA